MKKMVFIAILTVRVFLGDVYAQDDGFLVENMIHELEPDLVPEIKVGNNSKLKIWGWSHGTYVENREKELDLSSLNIRSNLTIGDRWEAFLEVEAADSDWLKSAWVGYRLEPSNGEGNDDAWIIKVGRVRVAGGFTTPPPFAGETVSYPKSDPFGYNGWGVQLEGAWGDGWQLIADFTTETDTPFDSRENWNFDNLEASARLEKKFDDWSLAGTVQISSRYQRFALDSQYKTNRLTVRGSLYYAHNEDKTVSDHFGGYLFAGYRVTQWLELHGMIDHSQSLPKRWTEVEYGINDSGEFFYQEVKYESSDITLSTLTVGSRFFIGDNITITGDVVLPLDGEDTEINPGFEARIQVRF